MLSERACVKPARVLARKDSRSIEANETYCGSFRAALAASRALTEQVRFSTHPKVTPSRATDIGRERQRDWSLRRVASLKGSFAGIFQNEFTFIEGTVGLWKCIMFGCFIKVRVST